MCKRLLIRMLILSLCILFFLAGCGEKNLTPSLENQEEATRRHDLGDSSDEASSLSLTPPRLTVIFNHEYSAYHYELPPNASHLFAWGPDISLTLEFDEVLDRDSYLQYLKPLEGEHLSIVPSLDLRTFELRFTNIKKGEALSFTLNNQLANPKGLKLKQDMTFDFLISEPIQAAYTILGEDYSLSYPTGNDAPSYGEENKLTNSSQRIRIDFSQEVNQKEVEQVFQNQVFTKEDSYSFHWEDLKTLYLTMEQLTPGAYQFELFSYSTPIVNGLYFEADQSNILYRCSLQDERVTEEKIFQNYRYHFNRNPAVQDYLLMVDTWNPYLYNLEQNRIEGVDQEGLPSYWGMGPWNQEVLWLDPNTILWIEDYQVNTYHFKTRTKEILFSLEDRGDEYSQLFEYALSPDKQLLAIAEGTVDYEAMTDYAFISVYRLTGEKLFGDKLIENIRATWLAGPVYFLYMGWANDAELIYEASTGDGRYGVVSTNIYTDETRRVFESGIEPVTAPNSGVYAARHENGYFIQSREKNLTIASEVISDLIVYDEKTLFYTRENSDMTELIRYDLSTEKAMIMGTMPGTRFRILGYSHDQEHIYLISNQRILMPIT